MKAKYVYESISFERGNDPIKTIGLGKYAIAEKLKSKYFPLPSFSRMHASNVKIYFDDFLGFCEKMNSIEAEAVYVLLEDLILGNDRFFNDDERTTCFLLWIRDDFLLLLDKFGFFEKLGKETYNYFFNKAPHFLFSFMGHIKFLDFIEKNFTDTEAFSIFNNVISNIDKNENFLVKKMANILKNNPADIQKENLEQLFYLLIKFNYSKDIRDLLYIGIYPPYKESLLRGAGSLSAGNFLYSSIMFSILEGNFEQLEVFLENMDLDNYIKIRNYPLNLALSFSKYPEISGNSLKNNNWFRTVEMILEVPEIRKNIDLLPIEARKKLKKKFDI
jgi:hypothetical protein